MVENIGDDISERTRRYWQNNAAHYSIPARPIHNLLHAKRDNTINTTKSGNPDTLQQSRAALYFFLLVNLYWWIDDGFPSNYFNLFDGT